jgi:hypothetical protein
MAWSLHGTGLRSRQDGIELEEHCATYMTRLRAGIIIRPGHDFLFL